MVDSTDDLNLDVDSEDSGKKKTLLIIVGGVLLLVAAVLGTLFAVGFFSAQPDSDTNAVADTETSEAAKEPPSYWPMKEPLTVNLASKNTRYIQVGLTFQLDNTELAEGLEKQWPKVRNDLIVLLSKQDTKALASEAGKQALRDAIIGTVNTVLAQRKIEGRVRDVFFTKLVMQ